MNEKVLVDCNTSRQVLNRSVVQVSGENELCSIISLTGLTHLFELSFPFLLSGIKEADINFNLIKLGCCNTMVDQMFA